MGNKCEIVIYGDLPAGQDLRTAILAGLGLLSQTTGAKIHAFSMILDNQQFLDRQKVVDRQPAFYTPNELAKDAASFL